MLAMDGQPQAGASLGPIVSVYGDCHSIGSGKPSLWLLVGVYSLSGDYVIEPLLIVE